jgi:hypothetical protein
MSDDPYPIADGSSVKKPPSESTHDILVLAGQDPDKWYASFTSGRTFLGVSIRDPIHVLLAQHLCRVEQDLVTKYGDVASARTAMGLDKPHQEEIIGSRKAPTSASISMHMFGLAIDVDYQTNPFIGAGSNDIFSRAGLLVGGQPAAWQPGDADRPGDRWDELTALNATVKAYFALLDDDKELGRLLKAAPDRTWKDQDGHDRSWRDMPVEDARKQIDRDLRSPVVRHKEHGRWITDDPGGLAPRWTRAGVADTVVKPGGFLGLNKELVLALKLSWGAAYGDNMHFDMRNIEPGRTIFAKIREYQQANG